jgi:hypothetical protein
VTAVPSRRPAVLAVAVATALLAAGCAGGTATPPPSASPVTPEPAPPAERTLPPTPTATGAAVGELAPGFPTELVPVPGGSEILVSAASTDADGITTLSLNLRSPLGTAELVAPVREQLVAAGFTETDAGASGLAASSTFTRGAGGEELLTLGVLDRDGVRTLTLGGTVRS